MSTEIRLPKLGFDMETGKIVNWLKQPGDRVQSGTPLLEVETDKATLEVEAFDSGILTHLLVEVGETVPVGEVIALLDGEDEDDSPIRNITSAPNSSEETGQTRNNKISVRESTRSDNGDFIIASPLARRIASDLGIDLSVLEGTGPRGMIVKRDISEYQDAIEAQQTRDVSTVGITPKHDISEEKKVTHILREPLSKIRGAIARKMTESATEIPQFTVSINLDMTKIVALRGAHKEAQVNNVKLSINDFIIRGVALALQKYPRLNSTFTGDAIEIHKNINIGIAVALEDGLITICIPQTDQKALSQIATESQAGISRAKENKLRSEDIERSTFTVSNLGMFGVDHFTAIINPPEAAILAIGAVQEIPWNVNGEIKLQPRLEMTLSVDHRVSDGAEAARFLQVLKNYLEEPLNLI